MLTDVVEIESLRWAGVEDLFDTRLVGSRPVFIVGGPVRVSFDDEGFSVGVEGVGHERSLSEPACQGK